MEVVASRFFSHSICSLLTAAKRAGGKTKRHCQINLIHPVIESFCFVFFRRERCFIEFEITKRIPMRSFVSGQRSRLRHQPLFRTQIERPVKERVVTAFLVKLFRIRCRNCADPYFAVVASPPLLSGSCDCLAMAALSDLSICLPMSVRTKPEPFSSRIEMVSNPNRTIGYFRKLHIHLANLRPRSSSPSEKRSIQPRRASGTFP